MKEKNNLLLPFIILTGGIVLSVIIFSFVWKSAKNDNMLTVTGSAKRSITSDFGIQEGTLQVANTDKRAAYQTLLQQMPIVIKFIEQKGFKKEQIEVFGINGRPVMELTADGMETGRVRHYVYSQRFKVTSNEINKIKELSFALSSLVEKGLEVEPYSPEYIYTKIDEIKVLVQADAAKNAKMRAEFIAKANERDLGLLKDARMGIIQITPPNSNQISDYGINDVSSIEKEIKAVVSASFELK